MIELNTINTRIKFTLSESSFEILKNYKFYERTNVYGKYIYGVIGSNSKSLYKLILNCNTQGKHIIHKDGNMYNYCLDNLALGRRIDRSNTNKYKGINIKKQGNTIKYLAIVYKDNNQYTFRSDSEIEAAIAYNILALKHLGEYADLNKVKCENYDELFKKINDLLSKEKNVRKSERGQGLSKGDTKTSKYVGVLYSSEKNKWVARIKKDGKSYHICNTNNEEDAAKAYDAKALELYGENATLNFPKIDPDVIKKEYQKILKNNVYNRHITSQGGNRKNTSKKSSKYVGVSKNKSTNKWESYITFNYKRYFLGHYQNEEDAARAYDNKALKLYGKNAKLNFPLE